MGKGARESLALVEIPARGFFVCPDELMKGTTEMADDTAQGEMPENEKPAAETAEGKAPDAAELLAELERTRKALKDANKEAAQRRKRLEELEAEEARRSQDAMSETEKLKAQLTEAQQKAAQVEKAAQERIIRAEVLAQATRLHFADPADAYALLDKSALAVNDNGEVDGLEDALKELAKAKPYMLRRAAAQLGATNPGDNASGGETLEQRRARVYGSQNNPFDAGVARQQGGGVFFKDK